MSRPFKIGDVCEIVCVFKEASGVWKLGAECTVLSQPVPVGTMFFDEGLGLIRSAVTVYLVECNNGHRGYTAHETLRLKKPPPEVSSWESIEKLTRWNPTKVGEPA